MEKLRKFFDKGFYILFFILGGALIVAYVLKGLILGKFPGVDELNLFYNFNPLFFVDLPSSLEIPFFINVFDIFSLFLILIIFKIIKDQIEEGFPERMLKRIWLAIFLVIVIGAILSYFIGIILSVIVSMVFSIIISVLYSVFINKNSSIQIDLIMDMLGPFVLISSAMIIGVGAIYGLTISVVLIILFVIGIFVVVVVFIIIFITTSWMLKGLSILVKKIRKK